MELPLGTLLNIAAVIVGSGAGLLLQRGFPERYRRILLTAGGLATLALGAQMAVQMGNPLILIGSLYLGALVGEALGVEAWLERVGQRLGGAGGWPANGPESKSNDPTQFAIEDEQSLSGPAARSPDTFTTGLVTAFLIFCVGPMTILGSLNEGITGNHELLYVKSGLDLVTSFVLASSFGSGVLVSVIPLAIFQLALTGIGMLVGKAVTDEMVTELTAVGGALIIGLGLNLLGVAKLRVANLLPALGVVVLLLILLKYLPSLL